MQNEIVCQKSYDGKHHAREPRLEMSIDKDRSKELSELHYCKFCHQKLLSGMNYFEGIMLLNQLMSQVRIEGTCYYGDDKEYSRMVVEQARDHSKLNYYIYFMYEILEIGTIEITEQSIVELSKKCKRTLYPQVYFQ